MKSLVAIKTPTIVILFLLTLYSCGESKEHRLSIKAENTFEIKADDTKTTIINKAANIVPTENQYENMKDEFIAFIHFGPNTFTALEWGTGKESPKVFNPTNLDTNQWCKLIVAAGMKKVILTTKHHDGFCLWPSRYTKHSVAYSMYKNGNGDILKDLARSCAVYGLKLGLYLSPSDLYQMESPDGLYGNLSKKTKRIIPRPIKGRPFKNSRTFKFKVDDYNEYYLNQLFEILTEYGPISEVWLDGAHPKRKGNQQYDFASWEKLIHKLAPKAVIFGRADARWCGNEQGDTRDTEWNVIPYMEDPNKMKRFKDLANRDLGSRKLLYKGKFLHYQYAEVNTTIREGWFYRDENEKVKTADEIFDIYERAVGGNAVFLLNIPPNKAGKFTLKDANVLKEVGKRIKETYSKNLLFEAKGPWACLDNSSMTYTLLNESPMEIVISTPSPVTINRFLIQEAISTHSERVEKHALDMWDGEHWKEIVSATNIGYKRILKFPKVTSQKFRLRILESRMPPAISNITAHYYSP